MGLLHAIHGFGVRGEQQLMTIEFIIVGVIAVSAIISLAVVTYVSRQLKHQIGVQEVMITELEKALYGK